MKRILGTLVLASVAIALPQAPNAGKPTTTSPTATTPKIVGQLPPTGLKGLPWPGFGDFGVQLGFDPAKATPDGKGGNCQTAPNGNGNARFCFSETGGSFFLPHPGGAFDGVNWNPLSGAGSAGGLLFGAVGSPDDVARVVTSRFTQNLRAGDIQGLKDLIVEMQEYVTKLEDAALPKETGISESLSN